jgi:hypothetical protein
MWQSLIDLINGTWMILDTCSVRGAGENAKILSFSAGNLCLAIVKRTLVAFSTNYLQVVKNVIVVGNLNL